MSDEPGAASDEGQRRPLATEGHAAGDVRGGWTKQVAFAVGEDPGQLTRGRARQRGHARALRASTDIVVACVTMPLRFRDDGADPS